MLQRTLTSINSSNMTYYNKLLKNVSIESTNAHINLLLILQQGRMRYVTCKSHLILVVDKNLRPSTIPDESQITINR